LSLVKMEKLPESGGDLGSRSRNVHIKRGKTLNKRTGGADRAKSRGGVG